MALETGRKSNPKSQSKSSKNTPPIKPRIFTIDEAKQLLPLIRRMTDSAVKELDIMARKLDAIPEEDPEYREVQDNMDYTIQQWTDHVSKLGCDVKGLWLVDFDNGHGYLCWSYPEEDLDHFHSYHDGYSKRTRMC